MQMCMSLVANTEKTLEFEQLFVMLLFRLHYDMHIAGAF